MTNSIQSKAIEPWRDKCLSKFGAQEETPFGPQTLVYKVGGKMFALLNVKSNLWLNLKADPQEAMIIRETFTAVTPGYHMNKKHWITVDLEADLETHLIHGWIDDSYELVVKGLTKAQQKILSSDSNQ